MFLKSISVYFPKRFKLGLLMVSIIWNCYVYIMELIP